MKKNLLTVMATAGLFALSATNVLADDGKINFVGKITETACTVTNDASNPLTVTLGTVSKASLNGAAGKTAAATSFVLQLTNCPDSLEGHNANVTFDGVSANSDNTALQLTQASDVAKNVGVQISDRTGAVVPLYTPSSAYPLVAGNNSLKFVARYLSLASTVNPGSANSTSNFTIIYN